MIIATELITATTLTNIFRREVIETCTCRAAARLLFKATVVCVDGKSMKDHVDDMISELMESGSISYDNWGVDLSSTENLLEYGYDVLNDFENAYLRCVRMIDNLWIFMAYKTFDVSDS